jgi:hypothetical protein
VPPGANSEECSDSKWTVPDSGSLSRPQAEEPSRSRPRRAHAHQQPTNREGGDLVLGRAATEAFFASTIRTRPNKGMAQSGPDPDLPPNFARSATSSPLARIGSRSLGRPRRRPPDLEPLRASAARRRGRSDHEAQYVARTPGTDFAAHPPPSAKSPVNTEDSEYRYRDSKMGFRRGRRPDCPLSSPNVTHLLGKRDKPRTLNAAECGSRARERTRRGTEHDHGTLLLSGTICLCPIRSR